MAYSIDDKLKIAVTSRALFQLEYENKIYEEEGLVAYEQYQLDHEDQPLKPGAAFSLVKALLSLNDLADLKHKVEVIITSRNSMNNSIRVFNSLKLLELDISRGIFTGGVSMAPYLKALGMDLFLTANPQDAQTAIDVNIPAATLLTDNIEKYDFSSPIKEIRIAFDGDAVLFSAESEQIYKDYGLDAFTENEIKNANKPLQEGPFAKFLKTISQIQNELKDDSAIKIRTALITARNAPSHERVVRTLRAWNVRIDEAFFLGGIPKLEILKAFGAHIFFDDQTVYTVPASGVVPSGTVPYRTGGPMDY